MGKFFPEVDDDDESEEIDYYSKLWGLFLHALWRGLLGFRTRIKLSRFQNDVLGGGRKRRDTLALRHIINRRGRRPFEITKIVDGEEVKVNLFRIAIVGNDVTSSIWLEYGTCYGFTKDGRRKKTKVIAEDYIKWLKENPLEVFLEKNMSAKAKNLLEKGFFKNPHNDEFIKNAKRIREKILEEYEKEKEGGENENSTE